MMVPGFYSFDEETYPSIKKNHFMMKHRVEDAQIESLMRQQSLESKSLLQDYSQESYQTSVDGQNSGLVMKFQRKIKKK